MDEDEREKVIKNGYTELPKNAKNYLDYIVNNCNTKIDIVSIGPGRRETIECKSI